MSKLYDRKIEVRVGGQVYRYPDLEINFEIPKTIDENPDVAEICIYNLSDTSVNAIINNAEIIVNAGYGNDIGTIFTGKVEEVIPEWQGVDKQVTILATDVGSTFRNKEIEKTYKNTNAKAIISDLCKQLGIGVGEIKPANNKKYKDRAVNGNIYNEIRSIANETKSKMFTMDNKLYVRPFEASKSTGTVLNYSSGLIGSPAREEREETIESADKKKKDKKTVKIVEYRILSLLNHELKQDTWIKVESKTLNGKFRVLEVTHTKDFQTEVLVRP